MQTLPIVLECPEHRVVLTSSVMVDLSLDKEIRILHTLNLAVHVHLTPLLLQVAVLLSK